MAVIHDALRAANRVVQSQEIRKGDPIFIVEVVGSTAIVRHSGTFDADYDDLPEVNKGSHSGKLPTATIFGRPGPSDIFPKTYGLLGDDSMFVALNSVEPVDGVEFIDGRPDREREHSPLWE